MSFVELRKAFLLELYNTSRRLEASTTDAGAADVPELSAEQWLQERSRDLARLSSLFNEERDALSAFDNRKRMDQLTHMAAELHELRTRLCPRAPFKFRKKRDVSSNSVQLDASSREVSVTSECTVRDGTLVLRNLRGASIPSAEWILLDNNRIKLSASGLRGCSIHLPHCSAVHMEDIENCDVSVDLVDGAVHVSEAKASTINVTCHQFRLHDSQNLGLVVDCPTSPVVEGCTGVRIACEKPVLDFSWARPGPSPHVEQRPLSRNS